MKPRLFIAALVFCLLVCVGAIVWLSLQLNARNTALTVESSRAAELEVQVKQLSKSRDAVQGQLDEALTKFENEVKTLNARVGGYQARMLKMTQESQAAPASAKDRLPLKLGKLTTVEGLTYYDVTITAIKGDTIEMTHDAGAGSLPARRLPKEVRLALDLKDDGKPPSVQLSQSPEPPASAQASPAAPTQELPPEPTAQREAPPLKPLIQSGPLP